MLFGAEMPPQTVTQPRFVLAQLALEQLQILLISVRLQVHSKVSSVLRRKRTGVANVEIGNFADVFVFVQVGYQ